MKMPRGNIANFKGKQAAPFGKKGAAPPKAKAPAKTPKRK
jgi:hypothetical protein